MQQEIAAELAKTDLGAGVTFKLKGEDEEREKAGSFLDCRHSVPRSS